VLGILVRPEKCTGCGLCELACSMTKSARFDYQESRIRVLNDDIEGISSPALCIQCNEAYCVSVCPVNALSKDNKSGIINLDRDLCISCGRCSDSCPYGGGQFDSDGFPLFCDLCGGDPQCVKACPSTALVITNRNLARRFEHEKFSRCISTMRRSIHDN